MGQPSTFSGLSGISSPRRPGLKQWLLAAAMVIWAAGHLFSLVRLPLPTCDDGWYASTAYQFLQHGNFGMPTMNNLYGLGDSHTGLGRFYVAALAGSFALFGVGLFQARLVSLLGSVALILMTYYTGRRLYNERAGLIAALLVAFSWDVMVPGHLARPETWLAASEMGVLYLFGHVRRGPTFKKGLLFGFVAAVPMNLHPNGLLFLLAFGVLSVFELSLRRREFAILVGVGVGTAAGGLLWVLLHFLPDMAESYVQWASLGQSPVGMDVRELLGLQAQWFVDNYWGGFGGGAALQTVYLVAGVGLALRQAGEGNRTIIWLLVISLLAFTFLKVGKFTVYTLLWNPFLILLLAGNLDFVAGILDRHLLLKPGYATQFLISLPLLIAYIAGDGWLIYRWRDVDYRHQTSVLQEIVPSGASVTGEGTWWPGLGVDRRYLDDAYFEYLGADLDEGLSEQALGDEFDALGLDYVILDEGLTCSTVSNVTHQSLKAYLARECRVVGRLETPYYSGFKEHSVFNCGG